MNISKLITYLPLLISFFLLAACQPLEESRITYDAANLQFSGEQALALEDTFVTQFPNRASGMPNVVPGTNWLAEQFESYGLDCTIDEWQVINFSEPLAQRNVICRLPGSSEREIVLMAHHDQSPDTVYGADNDGSGIAILLHLAQLFAAESPGPYTLVFLATDGEEYGMLGGKRFSDQHPDLRSIIAAVSLDNLGKHFYDGLDMSPIGQFNGYGPAWLLRAARDSSAAAAAAGDNSIRIPRVRAPFDQVVDQAVPISFMDQGPLVAAGVPAFGFSHTRPAGTEALQFETYHTPLDTLELQSTDSLQAAGRATEALVRHLQTVDSFPVGSTAPYLYFAETDTVLAGPLLWLIIALFVAYFFVASFWIGRRSTGGLISGWRTALPHFLGLWLPLVLAVLSLYLLTAIGLLQKFELYFATPKSYAYYHPRWPAVILFLAGLILFLYLGRRLAARFQTTPPAYASVKSLAFFVIGLAALYGAIFNPFSLLLAVPLVFWLLIKGRRGIAFALDLVFFILGASLLLYLLYSFGFVVLQIDWYILWYVMMMIAVPMVGFFTMSVITAILASGLSTVVHAPALVAEPVESPVDFVVAD